MSNTNLLKVKSIEPKNKKDFPPVKFPDTLPQHAFTMLMVAPPGSGKTNLLCYMLLNLYNEYFHRIIVCSTTIDNDEKWQVVKNKKKLIVENKRLLKIMNDYKSGNKSEKALKSYKLVFDNNNELEQKGNKDEKFDGKIDEEDFFSEIDKLFPILEEQQNVVEWLSSQDYKTDARYIADRMLIILDDQAGNFDMGQKSPFNNFFIRHRHYSASVVVITQAYKAIPKTVRISFKCLVLFAIGNQNELRSIFEENSNVFTEDQWMKMYQYATREPYSFLYFNYTFPKNRRFFKRFESVLNVKEKGEEAELKRVKKSTPEIK
jgi:hypothetical protein